MSTRIMSGIQYIQSKTTWRTTERIKYPLQIGPPVGRLLLHVPPRRCPHLHTTRGRPQSVLVGATEGEPWHPPLEDLSL